MTRYVINAPTLLQIMDDGLVVHPGHQLVAPGWIRSEALQTLLRDVRRGRRTDADALRIHERITELKMRLLGDRASRGAPGGSRGSTTGSRCTTRNTWRSPKP